MPDRPRVVPGFSEWDLRDVQEVVALEKIDSDRFRSRVAFVNSRGFQFGGQLVGLAVEAASRTAGDRECHAVSGYFVRPGDTRIPLDIAVEAVFDGSSFGLRRTILRQRGNVIFVLDASFQRSEDGHEHGMASPPTSPPEMLRANTDLDPGFYAGLSAAQRRRVYRLPGVEFRAVNPDTYFCGDASRRRMIWMRAPSAEGAGTAKHRSLLAFLTDFVLASTATLVLEEAHPAMKLDSASLNQSMWFYRDHPVDQWLLAVCDTPAAQAGRGIGRADVFDASGTIVASAVQEVLMRRPKLDDF